VKFTSRSLNRSEYNHQPKDTKKKDNLNHRDSPALALDGAPDLVPRLLARLAGHLDALHGHGLELLGPLLHLLAEPVHLLCFFSSRASLLFATLAEQKAIEEDERSAFGGRAAVEEIILYM
jgi:hypothetical protein